MDTLAVRLTVPLAGSVKDFHPQVIQITTTVICTAPVTALRAMPGAPKKYRPKAAIFFGGVGSVLKRQPGQ
jgi:hypothetical protein